MNKKTVGILICMLFIETSFLPIISINESTILNKSRAEYKVGLHNHANGVSSHYIARTYNDCILNVTDEYDNILFSVNKSESNWDVITQIGDISVNYDYSTGIYFSGDSNTGAKYEALSYNTIPINTLNYSVEMKVEFLSGWGTNGLIFNYIDENNYGFVALIWERTGHGGIYTVVISDGNYDVNLLQWDLSPTDYILKVSVNNYDNIADIYVDNIFKMQINLPAPIYDIYVDDDAPPEWYDATHVKTIQEGINNASAGDSIFVYNGTYYENVDITKDGIKLIGEDKDNTIIDSIFGMGSGIKIENKNNITISNLTIRNARDNSSALVGNGILIFAHSHDQTKVYCFKNTIDNCVITNNSRGGVTFDSHDTHGYTENTTIKNCGIYNNRYSGIIISAGAESYGNSYVLNTSIETSNIYDNGFPSAPDNHGSGITILAKGVINNTIIRECNFYGNYDHGVYIKSNIVYGCSNNNIIYHNNFMNETNNSYDECSNYWDNATLQEGNYWSNFDEPSEGAWDNDSDGIVDSPYLIPGGSNQDNYPLMYPYNSVIPDFNMTLYVGWNLIGWYHDYDTTASSLSENITGCTTVSMWNASMQTYDTYIVGGPPTFDFLIKKGMGLFVDVSVPSIWHGEG